MKLFATLILIGACQKDVGTSATGSNAESPPGPGHLDLSMPKATHGGDVVATMRVQVTKTTVFVNGDLLFVYASSAGEVAPHTITERLAKALPAPSAPDVRVIIAADKHVEYGVVVEVIDGIKQRGYSAIALESAP